MSVQQLPPLTRHQPNTSVDARTHRSVVEDGEAKKEGGCGGVDPDKEVEEEEDHVADIGAIK